MIVLDTNVLSELMRSVPDERVVRWLSSTPDSALFTTSICRAEILFGVGLLPPGRRRNELEQATRAIFNIDFAHRVLPFDSDAADSYASIATARQSSGRRVAQADAMIAGIAHSRGARIATRNVSDFADCGIEIIDPWNA